MASPPHWPATRPIRIWMNSAYRVAARVQQLPLPTRCEWSQLALTLTGNSTSEGFLTASTNGQFLTLGGYNAAVGTAAPSGLANNQVVARINLNGTIDTSTLLSDAATSGNIRSVVSDGTNVWAATSAAGVRSFDIDEHRRFDAS